MLIKKVVGATKQDLEKDKKVEAKALETLGTKEKAHFCEVSAKTGFHVKTIFDLALSEYFETHKKLAPPPKNTRSRKERTSVKPVL
jgi:hypothetical protein